MGEGDINDMLRLCVDIVFLSIIELLIALFLCMSTLPCIFTSGFVWHDRVSNWAPIYCIYISLYNSFIFILQFWDACFNIFSITYSVSLTFMSIGFICSLVEDNLCDAAIDILLDAIDYVSN